MKKIVRMLIMIAILCILPVSVKTKAESYSGTVSKFQWFLENGILTLTGDGYTNNITLYTTDRAPWEDYQDQITTVVYGDGILVGNMFYFCNYPNLKKIIFEKQYAEKENTTCFLDLRWYEGSPVEEIIYTASVCYGNISSREYKDFNKITLYHPENLTGNIYGSCFKEEVTFCTYENGEMKFNHEPEEKKLPVAAGRHEAYLVKNICKRCGMELSNTSYVDVDGTLYEGYEYVPLNLKEHSEAQVRNYMSSLSNDAYLERKAPDFAQSPSLQEPFAPGVLSEESRKIFLGLLNAYRYIAGVQDTEKVTYNPTLEYNAMAGTLCQWTNKKMAHYIQRPDAWRDSKYNTLYGAAVWGSSNSNLAGATSLQDSLIKAWIPDYSESNLGHRHQLLKGGLKQTGFGWTDGYAAVYVDAAVSYRQDDWLIPSTWPGKATPLDLYVNALWHVCVGEEVAGDLVEVRVKGSNGYNAIKTSASSTAGAGNGGYILFTSPEKVAAGETYQVTVIDHTKKKIWSYDVGFFTYLKPASEIKSAPSAGTSDPAGTSDSSEKSDSTETSGSVEKTEQNGALPSSNPLSQDTSGLVGQSVTEVDSIITASKADEVKGSVFQILQLKAKKITKKSLTISWNAVSDAAEYVVYGAKCGSKYEKLAKVMTTSFTMSGLKKGTYYKFFVTAVKNDQIIATSKTIHAATRGGKVGNDKSVSLNKKKIVLQPGKKFKLKATAKPYSHSLKVKKHRAISFESSDLSIAVVNAKGKITAKAKGSCYIYAYAQDGVAAKCKVTVK